MKENTFYLKNYNFYPLVDFNSDKDHQILHHYMVEKSNEAFPSAKKITAVLGSNGSLNIISENPSKEVWIDDAPDEVLEIVAEKDWQKDVALLTTD